MASNPRPVVDVAGIGDELVILTADDAAALVDHPEPSTTRYAALYPSCRVDGCDNEPEPRERFCHRHVLEDAF